MEYCGGWKYVQYLLTIFVSFLIPIYWYFYGPQNFLWLSDIGLFLTVIALWLNSVVIMSVAAVGIFLVEMLWCLDFFILLLFNKHFIYLSDYMFDEHYPLALRILSLFHIATPIIWILYLRCYGYEKRALYYFFGLYWATIIMAYTITNPAENINWVFLPETYHISSIQPLTWLLFLAVSFPLLIALPTHYIFSLAFEKNNKHLKEAEYLLLHVVEQYLKINFSTMANRLY